MAGLADQLNGLAHLSTPALRAEWLRLYKSVAPAIRGDILRRGIATQLQEKAHGGLSTAACREVERLCRQYERNGEVISRPSVQIKPGTRLVRDWGGQSHHVLVLDKGYLYRDQTYGSLSQIACLITGTRWSGPRFFGIRSGRDA
jgi:hypothetical protein